METIEQLQQRVKELETAVEEIHSAASDSEYKHDNLEWIEKRCEEILFPKTDPAQMKIVPPTAECKCYTSKTCPEHRKHCPWT